MLYIDRRPELTVSVFDNILSEINLCERFKRSRTIVIKLNLTAGSYIGCGNHAITNIKLLRSLIKCILELDPLKTIYIAESDSSNDDFAFLKFEHLKIPESLELDESMLKKIGLLDLSRNHLIRVDNAGFRYFTGKKHLWLSETLQKADFIVSLCNLKTHSQTVFTGACKNLFGTLPKSEKWIYHPWINEVIHDIVLAVNPTLSIVDGFHAMDGNGPVKGNSIDMGFRLWSDNPIEVDIKACKMAGIKPKSVGYLKLLCAASKQPFLLKQRDEFELEEIKSILRPNKSLNRIIHLGLSVQRIGIRIQLFGNRIRSCSNVLEFIKILIRVFVPNFIIKYKNKCKKGDVYNV